MPVLLNDQKDADIEAVKHTHTKSHHVRHTLLCPYCKGKENAQHHVSVGKHHTSIMLKCQAKCGRYFSITVGGSGYGESTLRVNGDGDD